MIDGIFPFGCNPVKTKTYNKMRKAEIPNYCPHKFIKPEYHNMELDATCKMSKLKYHWNYVSMCLSPI